MNNQVHITQSWLSAVILRKRYTDTDISRYHENITFTLGKVLEGIDKWSYILILDDIQIFTPFLIGANNYPKDVFSYMYI